MKSKISLLMAIVLIAFATTQCKKKKADEPAAEDPITSTTPMNTMTEVFAVTGSPTQEYTVSATTGTTLNVNGVIIEIPANSFVTQASGTVSGVVTVNVKTILNKQQLILSGAGGGTTNSRIISTKGCVKVTASQNTQSLRISPTTTLSVKVPDGPSFPAPTKKFYTNKMSASDSTLVWDLGTDITNIAPSMDTLSATYQHNATLDSLKWLNVGVIWDSITTNKSQLVVKINNAWADKNNCAVYLSINGSLTIGALTDFGSQIFRISNIPNGRGAHLVAVGIVNGQYYSGIMSITTGFSPYNLNMNTTTLSQLKTDLLSLP